MDCVFDDELVDIETQIVYEVVQQQILDEVDEVDFFANETVEHDEVELLLFVIRKIALIE